MDTAFTSPPLKGLVAASFTPMNEDGSIAPDRVPDYAAHLAGVGVRGVFVNGTTGEGASLTSGERKQLAEAWVKAAPVDLRVIVHVGHNSLEEAQELAGHAESVGAFAVSAMAPGFFKPRDADSLVACCARVAAAAPSLPFYYYHIPSMSGVSIPCRDFLAAAGDHIPNLRGIKYTFEDLMDYLACLRLGDGRFDLVFGRDESLAAALAIGARGAIGSTYNFLAPQFMRLMRAYDEGDPASATDRQTEINRVIDVMIRHGGLAAGKAIMRRIGLDLGPVRLPLESIDGEMFDRLCQDLEAIGFPS
jgi:N-acetylneuraminate lyase